MIDVLNAFKQDILLHLAVFIWDANSLHFLVTSLKESDDVLAKSRGTPRDSNAVVGSSLETVYSLPSSFGSVMSPRRECLVIPICSRPKKKRNKKPTSFNGSNITPCSPYTSTLVRHQGLHSMNHLSTGCLSVAGCRRQVCVIHEGETEDGAYLS